VTPKFVDSWFYLSLLDGRDQHHRRVVEFASQSAGVMVTTRWVLAETANAFARSAFRPAVAAFLESIEHDPAVKILEPSDTLYRRGLQLYGRRTDKAWSLTDCISFVAMEDEMLKEALTADRHFTQAGFVAVFDTPP
jgi:predicted nucleic acid-binding protein